MLELMQLWEWIMLEQLRDVCFVLKDEACAYGAMNQLLWMMEE